MKALPLPLGRDREIRTALRTNQIARFVIMPSQKKIIIIIIIVVFDVVTITIMIIRIIINIMCLCRVEERNFSC